MTDILIRDVPDHVVASIDSHAARLGLSRSEYIRRQWARDASRSTQEVTADDLTSFAHTFRDIDDPDIMRGAWS